MRFVIGIVRQFMYTKIASRTMANVDWFFRDNMPKYTLLKPKNTKFNMPIMHTFQAEISWIQQISIVLLLFSLLCQSEIGVAAYSACTKLFGSWDLMLYILLAILVGMILILKTGESLYHHTVRKKKLANSDNSSKIIVGRFATLQSVHTLCGWETIIVQDYVICKAILHKYLIE